MAESGLYEAMFRFSVGLNVIRAGNTSGKSTALQAVVYALGLEKMWGPRVEIPLAHAMQQRIQATRRGEFERVVQSYVELEIVNGSGQVLTVRRDVVGGSDRKLIRTWPRARLEQQATPAEERDFFVQMPGAAQREDGFHTFLTGFLGWDLPLVTRFNGTDGPLYLETIFPMAFVEQKRGWSVIQGPFPTQYQIQDVPRRVMEFLLDLDIGRARRELAEIGYRLRQLRERWSEEVVRLRERVLKGCRIDLPQQPLAEVAHRPALRIEVLTGQAWVELEEAERRTLESLAELEAQAAPTTAMAASENETELTAALAELSHIGLEAGRQRFEVQSLAQESEALGARIAALEIDLQRHQDAIRLRSLGSVLGGSLADGHCPTCHQSVAGELLPVAPSSTMALDENEQFIKSQLKLYGVSRAGVERQLAERQAAVGGLDLAARRLRERVRILREALTRAEGAPSQARMAKIVELQAQLAELRSARERADEAMDGFRTMANDFIELTSRQKELAGLTLTPADEAKVTCLQRELRAGLTAFGFGSIRTSEVVLAEDNLRPVMEQRDEAGAVLREIGIDLSASDGARLKWAYYLALLAVARTERSNHPGMVIFDEPGQHQMEPASMAAMLRRVAETAGPGQQVIIATSQSESFVRESVAGLTANVQSFGELVLQRVR